MMSIRHWMCSNCTQDSNDNDLGLKAALSAPWVPDLTHIARESTVALPVAAAVAAQGSDATSCCVLRCGVHTIKQKNLIIPIGSSRVCLYPGLGVSYSYSNYSMVLSQPFYLELEHCFFPVFFLFCFSSVQPVRKFLLGQNLVTVTITVTHCYSYSVTCVTL